MSASAVTHRFAATPWRPASASAQVAAVWMLSFVLVLSLAFRGGGYDPLLRGQVGVALWWIVLVGALVAALPTWRLSGRAWTAIALLAGFAVWTALSSTWSESVERSLDEGARVATLLAVLVLAVSAQGRVAARHIVIAVGCAIAVASTLAVLSRLHPAWFPVPEVEQVGGRTSRLSYPLNSWNGLAALSAMGIPLLLATATQARAIIGQALAAAVIPVLVLCVSLTASRGGVLDIAVGLLVFLLLAPNRLPNLASTVLVGAASAILVLAADQRDALQRNLHTPEALQQGDELLAAAIVTCLGVALVQCAISLAARHLNRPNWSVIRPARARTAAGLVAIVVATAAVIAGAPRALGNEWEAFKAPPPGELRTSDDSLSRFAASQSGNGRYQLWQRAMSAGDSAPLIGIGAGTYEFWWARHAAPRVGFVRDAHSLYLETYGELGLIGIALLGAFVSLIAVTGVQRALGREHRDRRVAIAAATAACAAFATAAATDWVWELTVLPVAFLALAGVVLGPGAATPDRSGAAETLRPSTRVRVLLAVGAAAAVVLVAIPLADAQAVRDSQRLAAGRPQLSNALAEAGAGRAVQPYAASPVLQQALVLEREGRFEAAARAARAAASKQPTNWRIWLTLSRVEARSGHMSASVKAYRKARSLNPQSSLFKP